MSRDQHIAVLGAGIAGLSAGFFLKRKGYRVTVFEQKSFPGGNLQSRLQGGFTCESGPNTVLLNQEGIARLLEETGLLRLIISPDTAAAKNRFILKRGHMQVVPASPAALLRTSLLGRADKLRLLREPFIPKHSPEANPSLEAFAVRRFGRTFYDNFIVPFVTGIYAGIPSQMSARYTMKALWEAEQAGGSVFRGFIRRMRKQKALARRLGLPKQRMFTLKGGLGTLADALEEYLGEDLVCQTRVCSLRFHSGKYEVETEKDGKKESQRFDRVYATLPAYVMADLLQEEDPGLSEQLAAVQYVPVLVMHLGFKKSQVQVKTPGFGVLSLPQEKRSYLGILFNSRTFPHTAPADHELFTVLIGGARSPELTRLPDEELRSRILHELDELLGIEGEPVFEDRVHWPKGIPQYDLNHGELISGVENFEAQHPGFHIIGNYVRGISVSECIEKAYQCS